MGKSNLVVENTTSSVYELTSDIDYNTTSFGYDMNSSVNGGTEESPAGIEVRNVSISLVGLMLNFVTMFGIIKTREYKAYYKVYLLNISLDDAGLNLAMLVLSVVRGGVIPWETFCLPVLVLCLLFIVANPALILALALDRLHAVFFPLSYRNNKAPKCKAVIVTMAAWVVSTFFIIICFVDAPPPTSDCFPLVYYCTYAGLLYSGVFAAWCSLVTVGVYVTVTCKMTLCRHHGVGNAGVSSRSLARTREVTIRSTVLVAWCCVSYLPFALYHVWVGAAEVIMEQETKNVHYFLVTLLPFLNAIVDPFIFLWQLGWAAAFVGRVRRCCRKENSVGSMPTTTTTNSTSL